MQVTHVGVVGAGLMGSGIAEVVARSGYTTHVVELNEEALARGEKRVAKSLATAVERGKLTAEQRTAIEGRMSFSTNLDDLAPCTVVIEAIIEQLPEKRMVFEHLDRILPEGALLATNTSSLPIIEVAAATKRQDRVVGIHFFNPAPVMKLVELVRSIATSDATFADARSFAESLGKTVIEAQDRAGFVVNLLLIPFLTHAVRMYEAGHATKEDIDTGIKYGCGHPMGPLELADLVGLDTTLFVCETLYEEYGEPEYMPPPLLKRMVAAGYLGRKSGRGFYDYSSHS